MTGNDRASQTPAKVRPRVLFRVMVCLLVLGAGFMSMKAFTAMKSPPRAAHRTEHAMEVRVVKAEPAPVQVVLTGFGVVEPVTTVTLASQVSGSITLTHADLFKGRVMAQGETLFVIDTSDYETAVKVARASVLERQGALERLSREFTLDTLRLDTLKRTRALAEAEYRRVKELFEKSRVGNRSGVDQAEQAYNSAKDQADRLEISLALYPVQIREAEARLKAAQADLERAETSLGRCTVRAPFAARVVSVTADKGEYMVPGRELVTLADDSVQEIRVSLDAREASRWIRFPSEEPADQGWFARPDPVSCPVTWSESGESGTWEGVLDRVVDFDRNSRTLIVAVRIDNREGSGKKGMPLVDGMFCTVKIPGRSLDGVYRVPRWSVTTEGNVYVCVDGRLQTRPVKQVWSEDESVYLSRGIGPGDLIITTRLVNPLENSLVTVVGQEG